MNQKPTFIDNRSGNTLAHALAKTLTIQARESPNQTPDQLRIATAFFSPAGFKHIADHLKNISCVRLLLGADPSGLPIPDPKPLNTPKEDHERKRIHQAWKYQILHLEYDRDQLPFNRTSRDALEALTSALKSGNMEVRRYTKAFLHAKAYIHSSEEDGGIIAGSSNLTHAGLTHNLELNLGCYDHGTVQQSQQWFDDLWDEAEDYNLAEIYEVIFHVPKPWLVFLRALWQLYGEELQEERVDSDNLPLTTFQKHGVARAIRLIRERGGVIVADEVGLGKTFIAGEILQLYIDRRQRVLLICPAALRDSTWKQFLIEYHLYGIECVSFEQLAQDKQLRDSKQRPNATGDHLQRPLNEYQLIIVDEAHNYRNPGAPSRAAALRHLLFGKKRDLLLLTATPVNNSLWDLYHLIHFFVRQDAHLADRGILSIRQRFIQAMHTDPTNLSPDVLYPIIDATTVKRTRQFVKKHYSGDTIKRPDGTSRTIEFPKPIPMTVRYALEDQLPGFFDQLEQALDSEGKKGILFARYRPDSYRKELLDSDENHRIDAMTGLLRSGLLKRFESSSGAFMKTIQKMVDQHNHFLNALEKGKVITTMFLQEISGDDEVLFNEMFDNSGDNNSDLMYDATDFEIHRLKDDVTRDRDTLQNLLVSAQSITREKDAKLKSLSDELCTIAQQAENEASDSIDECQRRKVLIFSSFSDTVEWIWEFLKSELTNRHELRPYCNRLVAVSGSKEFSDVSKEKATLGFAPVSMQAPPHADDDLYDILITTDILAEGVNLQQCRHIINYDVPWNPMRLVQRHGRIDRINSLHPRVFLRTIFPVDRLNELLNLESRILNKLAMAAASVGVVGPLEKSAHGDQVFTETRQEIEKLIQEDPSLFERGGTVSATQTGEEYRQTLRKAYDELGTDIEKIPWKTGSGMKKGNQRGVFFCAVVGHETNLERTYLLFIPANSDWKPTPDENQFINELGTCLRLIECDENTETWYPDQLHERVYDFWEVAQSHILKQWTVETDPKNLQPNVDRINRDIAELIRQHPPLERDKKQRQLALDILESPWPRREQTELRKIFNQSVDDVAVPRTTLSNDLVQYILSTGLEPSQIPPPLPEIILDDIKLMCWVAIEPEIN
ncbi:MAG: helicase-related protein [Bacteroidetes bacterium]|nr:helicase-related protein [Bacteroidota bacterium]